jgi:glycosyltransferase involved in cell wall biosynthesis
VALSFTSQNDRPIHVMHLITDLDVGGAEMMLSRLIGAVDERYCRMSVVSMIAPGPVGAQLAARGVSVRSLGMSRAVPDPRALLRLIKILRREPVDVLQTWLYHADFLGLLAAQCSGVRNLVWNLQCSNMDFSYYSFLSAALPRLLARLSGQADLALVNSAAGKAVHERLGYRPSRWEIVPSGIDVKRFQPDLAAKARLCCELGIPLESFLICLPARVDPMKDHANFLAASAQFNRTHPNAYFILAGRGTHQSNEFLRPLLENTGCAGQISLLGERSDMPALLAGVDLVTLSSAFGEGWPNVVGEAMACGVPVVSTDVGDAAEIVGPTGIIVAPRDASALAAAWERFYRLDATVRRELGMAAHQRIVDRYTLTAVAARYEALYHELADVAPSLGARAVSLSV